jgi:hypothetical protein
MSLMPAVSAQSAAATARHRFCETTLHFSVRSSPSINLLLTSPAYVGDSSQILLVIAETCRHADTSTQLSHVSSCTTILGYCRDAASYLSSMHSLSKSPHSSAFNLGSNVCVHLTANWLLRSSSVTYTVSLYHSRPSQHSTSA